MMKFNYYTIGALPKLTWDSELPCTISEFIEEYRVQLEPLMDGVSDILLLNDVKNLELILKARIEKDEKFRGNKDDGKIDYYKARVVEPEELESFLEEPFINRPDENYPEFMIEYFLKYKTDEERIHHIEELYIDYFRYMQTRKNGFLRYYGRIATTIRTVLSAMRIMRRGLDLDKNLKGDPFVVQTILENRNNADLGLKNHFPKVAEVIALFDRDRDPIEVEKDLDRIRFELMEEVGRETPFADHIIYSYIIGFQVRNRWNSLNDEKGLQILENIIEGNY
ncbi:MAG TPA: DUF2764 family protein [bacterium]|nr:DUF2764 family protein [bacterium]HQJ60367.1 DUF2764 family protein [bacterium]